MADSSTEMADDSPKNGEKGPRGRLQGSRDGRLSDDAGSEGRIWSLIHNVFFSSGAGPICEASAVLSLSASLVLSPFLALSMSAVGGAQLLASRGLSTGLAAIFLAAITGGADEEEETAELRATKDPAKGTLGGD